ncbi:MAG TPA: chromate resistance protein ChrB domain-containing protein [Burkholderiales bacterium]|nr:chromate resistance protein ChrB domain-containing protein [Burkholderiales bacterium]
MDTEPAATAGEAPVAPSRWLVTVTQLPTSDPASRMRMLRTLESLGAAVMREGVYVLPDSPDNRRALERLAQYVAQNSGNASVLRVESSSEAQHAQLRQLFDRSARYEELTKNVLSVRGGFGVVDASAISRVLHKQRRDLEAIAALDFFPTAARDRAERTLVEAESAVRELLFPAQGVAAEQAAEPMQRRTWATRRPLWADRLACAWLIRRFIDSEAKLLWLDKGAGCPESAIGFGYEGARFTNSESRVTFENMLSQFGMASHAALGRIGSIVHFLEVRGTPVPEAAGVQTLLQGAVRRATSDDELLREAEKTFDLLYEAYSDTREATRG